jgi:hypothetical protein
MLTLKTETDLQRLVDEAIEETITALARTSKAIDELCKDVSAMANSAGGQIVYGIKENKVTRKPERVDDGVSDPTITRDWIVQILNSRVHPRMDGLRVKRIPLSASRDALAFIVSIEPTQIGPHQAPDHRYYKRFELHSVPMEDYEVRDVMRRATTPDLYLKLQLRSGTTQELSFAGGDSKSDPVPLVFSIGNRSSQPASHVIVTIGLDPRLTISSTGDYEGPLPRRNESDLNYLKLRIHPPNWLPIFKEAQEDELSVRELLVRISSSDSIPRDFAITARLQSPGFTSEQGWKLTDNDKSVELSEIE